MHESGEHNRGSYTPHEYLRVVYNRAEVPLEFEQDAYELLEYGVSEDSIIFNFMDFYQRYETWVETTGGGTISDFVRETEDLSDLDQLKNSSSIPELFH